ncbi:MAG TPA: hypothetical protein VJ508_12620, partial [Saprospiraceae bacterium]|nr:hypothetical protein [Saprospiraceae bacterium]
MPTAQFAEFIEFFPNLKPPFSLLPDLQQIPSDPIPLPGVLQDAYILPFEGDETDEYTEYIPFCKIEGTKGYHALIYWKAGVLRYEFILATYSPEGLPLSHAIIGGMRYEDEGTIHSVAVVDEDIRITIVEGMVDDEKGALQLNQTQSYYMAITPTGEIQYEMNEEKKE